MRWAAPRMRGCGTCFRSSLCMASTFSALWCADGTLMKETVCRMCMCLCVCVSSPGSNFGERGATVAVTLIIATVAKHKLLSLLPAWLFPLSSSLLAAVGNSSFSTATCGETPCQHSTRPQQKDVWLSNKKTHCS